MRKDTGGSAFPISSYLVEKTIEGIQSMPISEEKQGNLVEQIAAAATGMTLRDYFAAKAMQAEVAEWGSGNPTERAKDAYKIADAMIRERG